MRQLNERDKSVSELVEMPLVFVDYLGEDTKFMEGADKVVDKIFIFNYNTKQHEKLFTYPNGFLTPVVNALKESSEPIGWYKIVKHPKWHIERVELDEIYEKGHLRRKPIK